MTSYLYQLHDHFFDLRGRTRQEQLHLACLVTSINFNSVIESIMMTPNQFALKLIRSCYSNRPLTQQQGKKVKNIIYHNHSNHTISILLACQTIKKVTNILNGENNQVQKGFISWGYTTDNDKYMIDFHQIQIAKTYYINAYKQYKITFREKLNQFQLKILGIQVNQLKGNMQKVQQRWKKRFQLQLKLNQNDQKIIKKIQQNYNLLIQKSISIKQQLIYQNNKFVQSQSQQLNYTLPITKSVKNKQQTQISKQLFQDLQGSYKINQIEKKKQSLIRINHQKTLKILNYHLQCLIKVKQQLTQFLYLHRNENQNHPDIVSGLRSMICSLDFTQILCNPQHLYTFYPEITQVDKNHLINLIKYWMIISVEIDSVKRLICIIQVKLDEKQIDKVALMRQCQSPRKKIIQNISWVCFEVEMRLQIWLSQFETYDHLINGQNSSISQLNMGEGKTQVIIPMIIFETLYGKYKQIKLIPRINLLSSLIEEARKNYFKFFSVTSFCIPCIQIPFKRHVKLTITILKQIKFIIHSFAPKMIFMTDRQSTLSLILKLRQLKSLKMQLPFVEESRDKWLFSQYKVFDIFDQVDALMTPQKSFVYSIGQSSELSQHRIRLNMSRLIIEIVYKQMLKYIIKKKIGVLEESLEDSIKTVKNGFYPKGLRFIQTNLTQLVKFRKTLMESFFDQKYCPPQFQFIFNLDQKDKKNLIKFICEEQTLQQKLISPSIPQSAKSQIYAVRGIMAYGILEHCFYLRCNVDYGVPKQHPKRVAVPYEAAQVPSKRSQYAHPDVASILSYIAYYKQGLSYSQFYESLKKMMRLSKSAKEASYKQWVKNLGDQEKQKLLVKQFKQINMNSISHLQQLFNIFKQIRSVVSFWLQFCVFPRDLRQYKNSITASSWDIANVSKSIGFSGTKDNIWLFPNKIKYSPSDNPLIKGTDGKMLDLIIHNTIEINCITQGNNQLWKRFCQDALIVESGCIIDVGAILAGKSLKNQIIKYIGKHSRFNRQAYRGILFCNQNGKWEVYDLNSEVFVDRGTTIADHETFVIFDEARTRGADIKMDENRIASLSLAPNLTKDKLMQAVGRLRKFGRNQKIIIFASKQIFDNMEGMDYSKSLQDKIKIILSWSCYNTINYNNKFLFPNAKLGWIHIQNLYHDTVSVQTIQPQLKKMYSPMLEYSDAWKVFKAMIKQNKLSTQVQTKQLGKRIQKYGKCVVIKCQDLSDICERQVQMVQQTEKQQQRQVRQLSPIPENKTTQGLDPNIYTSFNYTFDEKLKLSENFLKCTQSAHYGTVGNKYLQNNQLCQIYFVYITNLNLTVITQKQAERIFNSGIPYYSSQSLYQSSAYISNLYNLSIDTPIIKSWKLQNSLVQAKFINGCQIFSQQQELILFQTFTSTRVIYRVQNKIEQLVTYFLKRRRTLEDKYQHSTLHKLQIKLKNQNIQHVKHFKSEKNDSI